MSIIASALILAAAPQPLAAQEIGNARPPGVVGLDGSVRTLDLSAWLGGGHDARIPHALGDLADPQLEPSNSHGQLGAGAAYARVGARLSLNGGIDSALRIDSATRRLWSLEHHAALGLGYALTHRTRVEARQVAKYAAVNPLMATPGTPKEDAVLIAPASLDHPFRVRQALTSLTGAVVTHAITRRSSVVFHNTFTYTEVEQGGALQSHSAGVRFERLVDQSRTIRLGYRLSTATFDPTSSRFLKTHDLDVGLAYQRQLPFSRRTLVTAGTGSSIITERDRRSFRMLADASLRHSLTRSWQARVDFSRPVQMMEGLAAPLVSTSVGISLTGAVGVRHRLIATAGYFDGRVSLDQSSDTTVTSYTSALRWQAALARHAAVNVEAFHGRLRIGPDVVMLSSVARDGEHLGVRAFVSFWRSVVRN